MASDMSDELFKAYWHCALGLVFGASAAHNLLRLTVTRKPINAINLALYAGLTVWELHLVRKHFTQDALR